VLIVDDGQDFSIVWRDILLRMLKDGGRATWLGDPTPNLYGREMVPLPGWVTLHSHTNYRSPRQIVDMLASIGEARQSVDARARISRRRCIRREIRRPCWRRPSMRSRCAWRQGSRGRV
jgi:hypothetical protein